MKPFRFERLDHCTILVTDVASARHFYGRLLGLRELPAPKEFDFTALWYELGNGYLHLLLKDAPDTPSPRHFCLHVDDLAAARQALLAAGVAIEETVRIAAADRFFIRDPFGNRIEILHWNRDYNSETDGAYRA